MKSLVADDDATNRMLLQTFLSRYGECKVASNGEEAVEAFGVARADRRKFDLICMDLRMPKMSGQEAIREIRNQENAAGIFSKGVKIIAMTAADAGETVAEALREGCGAFLLKPVDTARLTEEMKTMGLVR